MRGRVLGLVVVIAGCTSTAPTGVAPSVAAAGAENRTSATAVTLAPTGGAAATAGGTGNVTAGATPTAGGTGNVAAGATPTAGGTANAGATGLPSDGGKAHVVAEDAAGRPVNRALVAQGYRPTSYRGQLFYCRKQKLTGSQFSQKVCLTEQEAALQERIAQDNMSKRNWGVKCLPPLCPPTK